MSFKNSILIQKEKTSPRCFRPCNLFTWKALRRCESILGGYKDFTFQHSLKLQHRQAAILSVFILNVNTFCIHASFQMAAINLCVTFLLARDTMLQMC